MARYLIESKALFQHVPRTGGTWVENALTKMNVPIVRWLRQQPGWLFSKHCLQAQYHRSQMASVEFVFAFVRHPIAYYESVWKWCSSEKRRGSFEGMKKKRNRTWHPHRSAIELYQPDFDDWVFLMLRRDPLWYTRLIESYVGPEGGEFCDYIGRTETLADDFCKVMQILGCGDLTDERESELKRTAPANAIEMDVRWNSDLKAKVLESERLIVRRFYSEENKGRRHYAHLDQRDRLEAAGET